MTGHFQRYSAPDPIAHAEEIEHQRDALSKARSGGDTLAIIDLASDLASMLTTARREGEARELLAPLQPAVAEHLSSEPAGWYYLNFGTASQYLGLRAEANAMFSKALELSRAHAWERLEHFVLSHWARSLVEERDFVRAREYFSQALAIRERLGDPRAEKSRRALEALRELESGAR